MSKFEGYCFRRKVYSIIGSNLSYAMIGFSQWNRYAWSENQNSDATGLRDLFDFSKKEASEVNNEDTTEVEEPVEE